MPSTVSRAATKLISEVPGLLKQTSTPEATSVRTRLSAPFIALLRSGDGASDARLRTARRNRLYPAACPQA